MKSELQGLWLVQVTEFWWKIKASYLVDSKYCCLNALSDFNECC